MWIDDGRLKTIREPRPGGDAVDRLLSVLLGERTHPHDAPEACPICQQQLVVRTYTDLAIKMCPSEHGAWVTADDVQRMRANHARAGHAARRRLMAFMLLAVTAGSLFLVRHQTADAITGYLFPAVPPVTPVFANPLGTSAPLGTFTEVPINASAIDVREELVYLVDMLRLLEDGIDNRLEIDQALREPGDAAAAAAAFEPKQRGFLVQLRAMPVPGRLATFHRHLVVATENQIELYRAFAARRAADASVDLRAMLQHPALVATNREIVSAYRLFKQLYPDLDAQTRDAVYERLYAFDII